MSSNNSKKNECDSPCMMESSILRIDKSVQAIRKCLMGEMSNGERQEGVVHHVRSLVRWRKSRQWFERAVTIAILAGIIDWIVRKV